VVIVGTGFLGGEVQWGCRKGSWGGSNGGPEGGPADDPGGVERGALLCSAAGAGGLGDMWRLSCSSRCLISGVVGITGGLCHQDIGPRFRQSGLPNAGREWADGALVLVCRVGLHHTGGPAGAGGVAGSRILVAIRWISILTSWSWASRVDTQSLYTAAHSSTFPWKLARC